jgi:MYXO-CTERM domain-containing protein
VRKLALYLVLMVFAVPFRTYADHDRDDRHHRHIHANEVAGIGLGAAALVGVAGYFFLRRRHE